MYMVHSKYKNLLKDTLLFALGSIGSKLILFVMMPIYTNYLTQSEYGISELVFSVSQLLIPFISLVIFDAVVRFGLSKERCAEDVLLIGLLVFGAGSVLTILITPLIGLYDTLAEWKWYLCAYIIANILVSIEYSYLKATDQNKLYAVVNILQTLILAVLNVVLLVFVKMGVQGYLISMIAASAGAAAVVFLAGKLPAALKKARFRRDLLGQMLAFSAPLILNNVSWWAIHSSDKVMLELMIGSAALGVYTVATKIPSLINVIISIFSQAWNISAVKEVEGSNDTSFYSDVFYVYQFVVFGACIGIVSVVKPFMSIYVGEEFRDAWRYIPLLLLGASMSAIASYFGSLYAAMKKSVNNMLTTLSAALVNIAVNYVMIPKIGIMGAVMGTVAAYLMLAGVRLFDVRKFIEFP